MTVVFADVAYLNKTSDINGITVYLFSCFNGFFSQNFRIFGRSVFYQIFIFIKAQAVIFLEFFNQINH